MKNTEDHTEDQKPDTGAPGFFVRQPPAQRDPATLYGPMGNLPTPPVRDETAQFTKADLEYIEARCNPQTTARVLKLSLRNNAGLCVSQEVTFNNLKSDSQCRAIWDTLEELDWRLSVAAYATRTQNP